MKLFQLYHLSILLSSLAIASTVAQRYARRGCNDACGNVRIPYPFGIGAKCSVNGWYVVDCKSSTPYLSALNDLEILNVDLGNQTVTVNVSMNSDCRNPVRNSRQILNIGNLGRSPFLFSKLRNKFVVEGCGNAVIMDDDGGVLTGCSTICRNETINSRNDCLGVGCCKATIPHYLKSYTVDLTGLERQVGRDGGCGAAFLVDEKQSYDDAGVGKSYVPISLTWTLTDHDYKPFCYTQRLRLKLDLSKGAPMESWKCKGYDGNPSLCEGNPYLYNGYNCAGMKPGFD